MFVSQKNRKAFSLVEMIAAASLLSLAVVTICTISTKSMVGVKSNRKYEQAWDVLDKQLTMIDAMGIDAFLEVGQYDGQIGSEETGEDIYFWNVSIEEEYESNLYNVSLSISWDSGNKRRSISASTLLNGAEIADAELEIVITSGQ